ncbi:MAG: YceI family protein [Flavobacteriales bacterium]|nr:YceI family protein [Flavobacteriales bacterium]
MRSFITLISAAVILMSCGDKTTTGELDACSCAKEIHAQGPAAPNYAKCQEKINGDAKFKDDFSKCTAAEIMHRDTTGMRTESAPLTIQSDGDYHLATGGDSIIWSGQKITGKYEKGTVKALSATVNAVGGEVKGGEIVIDMKSISAMGIEDAAMRSKLENHLRGDDFFSVDKFPEAKFVITHVEKTGSTHLVKGDLTLKGKTNMAIGSLNIKGSGTNSVILEGAIQFDRSQFDVRYGSDKFFDNLGDNLIIDQVQIYYKLQMTR